MHWRKLVIIVGSMLLVSALLSLVLRDSLLQWGFRQLTQKALQRYQVNMGVSNIQFKGWRTINVSDFFVQKQGVDTLLRMKHVEVEVSLLSWMLGSGGVQSIAGNDMLLSIKKDAGGSNADFLVRQRNKDATTSTANTTTADKLTRYIRLANRLLKANIQLTNIGFIYADTSYTEQLHLPELRYDNQQCGLFISPTHGQDTLFVEARVQPSNNKLTVTMRQTHHTDSVSLPFVRALDGLTAGFDTLQLHLQWSTGKHLLELQPSLKLSNFHIRHWRIARQTVVFPSILLQGTIRMEGDVIKLDTATTMLRNLPVYASGYYQKQDTSQQVGFQIRIPEVPADTLLHALPYGMFNSLNGMSLRGTLSYRLQFAYHSQQPDSLIFESEMKQKKLSIAHYGTENFARVNGDFLHEVYVKEAFQRAISVSASNPNFTPIKQISPFLIGSVLQAEDPSFMQHRGFLSSAFREAMIKNIQEKRFARGGSTITMQLVKNLFLNRDKNIGRKAEEALIVYLIETLGLIPKERMLEIYLNIIEWGPNVYGIAEASQFYFGKRPAALNLQESIFLAGIIPNPRVFKYHFDKSGSLRPHFAQFYKILANRMVLRGVIAPQDTVGLNPHIQLKGPAHQFLPINTSPVE